MLSRFSPFAVVLRTPSTSSKKCRVANSSLPPTKPPASTFFPSVFAEFKKQFPNVQLLVDRSYGTRVVQAVIDNLADFGITQLPVQEKKLQVVKIHSDEIKLLVPAGHRLPLADRVLPQDLLGEQMLLPKTGTTRARLNVWLDSVQDELNISMELDSTEMIKRFVMADLGRIIPGGFALPGRSGRRNWPAYRWVRADDPPSRVLSIVRTSLCRRPLWDLSR